MAEHATLPDTVKQFEERFTDVSTLPPGNADLVCSAGVVGSSDLLPALFSTPRRAIWAWLDTATRRVPPGHDKLEWILKPELCEFQITMADKRQSHRLVSNRFAVKSQFKTSKQ